MFGGGVDRIMTTEGHLTLGERVVRKKSQCGAHQKGLSQSHMDTMCSTVNYCNLHVKLLKFLP